MPFGFNSIELFIQCIIGSIFFLGTIFWLWMLIDCALSKRSSVSQKVIWILVMLFTHLIGALLYFFFGRSPKQAQIVYQPYPSMQSRPPQVPPTSYYPYQQGYQAAPPMPPPYQPGTMPHPEPYEQQPPLDYEQPQAMYPHEQNNE